VSEIAAGLHLIAALPERYGPQERFLVDVAAAGVTVCPLSDRAHTPAEADGKEGSVWSWDTRTCRLRGSGTAYG
jgi:GntR family transcriptional regulator/MocR family aminotransferase